MNNASQRMLRIADIDRNVALQARVGINEETVEEYADSYRRGVVLPPPRVFFDGHAYWPGDGFHRIQACERTGSEEILCEVTRGTLRDAILFAAGANRTHGLRRSNDDKRKAVSILLGDDEWLRWSNRRIAEHCGVSDVFVGNLRRELGVAEPDSRRGSDGRTIHTGNIGRGSRPTPTANGSQSAEGDSDPPSVILDGAGPSAGHDDVAPSGTRQQQRRVASSKVRAAPSSGSESVVEVIGRLHRDLEAVLAQLPGEDPAAAREALVRLLRVGSAGFRAAFQDEGDE